MKRSHPAIAIFLIFLAVSLWAVFLTLLTLCLRWLGTSFPWVIATSLVAAWGVWTVVIARSRLRPDAGVGNARSAAVLRDGTKPAVAVLKPS